MTPAPTASKGLTPDAVVAAALELVEAGGIAALSMRKLGAALGVEAMSLYSHFPTKHAIELAMCDHILDGIELDASADPVAFANAIRRRLVAHPETTRLFAANMNLQESPAVQRLTLTGLSVLARRDRDATVVLRRFAQVLAFVVGHTLLEIAQREAGAPPTQVYDADAGFDTGVRALLAAEIDR
jgi:TetR/AcrR family transcriptional regulator, tetracycline repressor protein